SILYIAKAERRHYREHLDIHLLGGPIRKFVEQPAVHHLLGRLGVLEDERQVQDIEGLSKRPDVSTGRRADVDLAKQGLLETRVLAAQCTANLGVGIDSTFRVLLESRREIVGEHPGR